MIRGERFELDLGSDDENERPPTTQTLPAAFVGNVLERQPKTPKAPVAPTMKSKTGFPGHRSRSDTSRFKQRQAQSPQASVWQPATRNEATSPTSRATSGTTSWQQDEMSRIDQENRQKLASMSSSEIEEERRELMSSFSPAFIERLMQRSNRQTGSQMQKILQQSDIESGSNEADLSKLEISTDTARSKEPAEKPGSSRTKTVTFAEPNSRSPDATRSEGEHSAADTNALPPHGSVHFPRAPQPPELDPSSETFLEDLHQKYFPSLPADPDKLEWMQSSTAANTYDPDASALSPEQIRFSFKGELIPPRLAAEIPVTEGLHHHGDAPDSAGYTVPELARLACSSYPAQRCIAFQTLGRILYRLGKGEFGNAGEPGAAASGEESLSELARELWGVVEREKVVELLVLESEGRGVDKGRHLSAKSYATEAVWLWQKGGGRRWKAS